MSDLTLLLRMESILNINPVRTRKCFLLSAYLFFFFFLSDLGHIIVNIALQCLIVAALVLVK